MTFYLTFKFFNPSFCPFLGDSLCSCFHLVDLTVFYVYMRRITFNFKLTSKLSIKFIITFPKWIFLIQMPTKWVGQNIFTDTIECFIVADNVLIVVALPERCGRDTRNFVDAFGNGGFE